MKFAKRLEAEAVAEWRPKYLQYKQLKKLIKVIAAERSSAVSQPGDLERNMTSELTATEVLFFERFTADLGKIEDFYVAREREAIDRKFKIMAQLHILPAEEEVNKKGRKRRGVDVSPGKENPASVTTWRSLNDLSGCSSEDIAQLSNQMSQRSPNEKPEHLKISSLRPASFTHLARQRIKKALLEYYRMLELLRNFKTLNIIGCAKILKKYDKNACRNLGPKYMEMMRGNSFYKNATVDGLMGDVENIYRWVFTNGDRGKALRKLRVRDLKNETFHTAATFSGALLSLCLALVVHLFSLVIGSDSPVIKTLGIVYFGLGLPFLMAWLFAMNAEVWERYYVNYRFIFEFNQRNNLHICQYSVLVGILSLAYLCIVAASLHGWLDAWIRPMLHPWLIITLLMLFLVWPANHFYRSSRIWFARVILRILTAPFYPCRFKDFFINDQYMSIGGTFEVMGTLIFYTAAGTDPKDFNTPAVWYVYFLQLLPGLWRSLQCLRRFHDSKMAFPHLANLAKYVCSLMVIFILGVHKIYNPVGFYWVLIAARIVSSTFSLGWDIVMDFGLWQRSSVNDRLRSTILFRPWIYWYLIASDFLARYLWILPLVRPSLLPAIPPIALTLALWTVEALRRFQWNFFRVEYEHVNNCNVMRAVADVQLPFTRDLFYQDMVEETIQQQNAEPTSNLDSPAPMDGTTSPCSSMAGDDLDEEEYGESLTYEQQLEMVQKSVAEQVGHDEPFVPTSPLADDITIGSGWSSPSHSRPIVSSLFVEQVQDRPNDRQM
jgi:hypothetical protein